MFQVGIVVCSVMLVYVTSWYCLALWTKRNDWADVAWGPGFSVTSLACLMSSTRVSPLSWLLFVMVSVWAMRLCVYIFLRNQGKEEDFRYRQWRKQWGQHFYWRTYLQVFLLQGLFLILIGMPIWFSIGSIQATQGPTLLTYLGSFIWFAGFGIELIADAQMALFKKHKKNPNKIMRSGLWQYSRHPNYFGEALLWWGIYLVALSNAAPFWTVIGPIALTFLLVKVSGIPMLEKKYQNNKEYREYQKNTSSFIPWSPSAH